MAVYFSDSDFRETSYTAALKLDDTDQSNWLTLDWAENDTGDRTLGLYVGGGSRTLTLNGNATLNDWFDQSVKAAATPAFAGLTLTAFSGYVKATAGTISASAIAAADVPISSSATGLTYTSATGVFTLTTGYIIPTTTEQSNWGTAYTDRLKWDGGSTGLTAATGRTSLALSSLDSVTFANITDSGLTAKRIPYAGAAGLLSDYAGLTWAAATGATIGSGILLNNYATNVFCIGDSLTSHTHDQRSMTNRLMDQLGRSWRIVNKGTGGNLTAQMVTRFAADVTALAKAGDYVVIWGGVNDAINDVLATTTEANLQTMYTAAAAAGMKVIALTIAPWKNYSSWSADRQTRTDAVNAWIMSGTPTGVTTKVDMFTLMENTPGDDLFNVTYCDVDLLHPNALGIDWMADFVYSGVTWTPTLGLNASVPIVLSSAEGAGAYYDLRVALPATANDVFIMQSTGLALTIGYTASTTPTLNIIDAGTGTYLNRMSINYSSITGGPSGRGSITFPNTNGTGFIFQRCYADQNASDVFTFNPASGIEMTDADGRQAFIEIDPLVKQTSTAAFDAIRVNATLTSVGTGATGDGNNLLNLSVSASPKFKVDTAGGVTFGQTSVSLADNAIHDTGVATFYGLLIVKDTTTGVSAVYRLDGGATPVAVSAHTNFSTAQGTNDKVNVYFSTTYKIENCFAAASVVKCAFIGC